MPEIIKNPKAVELLNRAAALEAELGDTSKTYTLDEVKKRVEDIAALKQRADVVAGATEQAVEQRVEQGVIAKVKGPEAKEEEDFESDYQSRSESVFKAFGGFGRYILSIAQRGSPDARPWTERQKKAHAAMQEMQQRVVIGTASDHSGGEFLLPLTQAPDIFVGASILQGGLFERAPKYPCPGRTTRIPYLKQDDATGKTRPLSGISATAIVGEGAEKTEHEPELGQRTVTAYKYAAYTEWADEVMDDDYTGQGPSVLQMAVGNDILNSMNAHVTIDGSGTAQPLGALHTNNGALITVNRDTSQQIKTVDVFTMMSKHTMGPGSFWLAHPSAIPQLFALQLTSGSQVTFIQNLNGSPSGILMGFPIVFTHLVSLLGVAGDLALIDPTQYGAVARRALTMQSSIHYKFRDDITAFRFFARGGGLPIPTSTYSYKASGGTKTFAYSGFVRLGDDATS